MQTLALLLPLLYALFFWWFSTGLVMVLYGRSPRARHWGFAAATLLLLGALWIAAATRGLDGSGAVYAAYTAGVVIWGWQTASYYLGYITGPREQADLPAPSALSGRFWRALRASLYHELVAAAFAGLLFLLTRGAANRWALWTYLALWGMHSSAKLTVFFGVRNFHIQMMPDHMHHLERLLGKRSSNGLLLLSVTLASSVALTFYFRAILPATSSGTASGYVLLGTLILLGVLEHLLLVLPLPATLWGWRIRPLPTTTVRAHSLGSVPVAQRHALSEQVTES